MDAATFQLFFSVRNRLIGRLFFAETGRAGKQTEVVKVRAGFPAFSDSPGWRSYAGRKKSY
jgi:hypothetical protein